ncbi:MAG: 1-acyl-sn-glycerol-3-phosphate acyltransferase [Paludibacteraceae bacterium]|nr:1-acyl-sn-glycerol-3-phosphate acyltransferase [Paludibacteraceae bacterium]
MEFRYHSFDEDVIVSANQDYRLGDDYRWLPQNGWERLAFRLMQGVIYIVAVFYCHLVLHVRLKGRRLVRQYQGCFIYGNHTQPAADALTPIMCAFPRKIFAIETAANHGIPVLGKLIRYIGAIPLPQTRRQSAEFEESVRHHITTGHSIMIYPEAHQWPYYTGIRPFTDASFRFPVDLQVPCLVAVTTYHKPLWGKKPRVRTTFDGPFAANPTLDRKTARQDLYQTVRARMEQLAAQSDYCYHQYTHIG